jgi:uncharacterized protein YpiB (UPF0302 family)
MQFEMGQTYEFNGNEGKFQFKFITEFDNNYLCEYIGGTSNKHDIGEKIHIFKNSRLLKTYKATKIGGLDFSKVNKKRRTKEEIAMDDFLENCLAKRKIELLQIEIDEALAAGDEVMFMRLTREVNRLRKKVSA